MSFCAAAVGEGHEEGRSDRPQARRAQPGSSASLRRPQLFRGPDGGEGTSAGQAAKRPRSDVRGVGGLPDKAAVPHPLNQPPGAERPGRFRRTISRPDRTRRGKQDPSDRAATGTTLTGLSATDPASAATPTTVLGGSPVILVVDDEPAIREALRLILTRRGYQVHQATDGEEALRMIDSVRPDLVILDIVLPGMDGLTACRRLRARGNEVPVLILTGRETVGDRVTGLDTGADDYVVKPFATDELVARICALLRRSRYQRAVRDTVLTFAGLSLDTASRSVARDGRLLRLSRTEFALLELFMARPRRVLKREWLLKSLWGGQGLITANSLDVYVMYLRRKMEAGGLPRLLHTVRGVGYALDVRGPVLVPGDADTAPPA